MVDDVFCLKSDDVVDSASPADDNREPSASAAGGTELSQESGLDEEPQPGPTIEALDQPAEDQCDKVDSAPPGPATEQTAEETTEQTNHGSTEAVSSSDEGNSGGQPRGSPNFLSDSLSGAKRLPKAAVSILRLPYDSIRRPVCESPASGSTSGDEAGGDAAAVESPAAAAGPGGGLMSRTLGSISALPSLFGKASSTDSAAATAPAAAVPSPPRSESSPASNKTRGTFFFQRLVGRSTTDSSEPDVNATADDGNYRRQRGKLCFPFVFFC